MEKRGLEDLPADVLSGARVLVRVDYNVPLENGAVADDTRVRATIPTLQYLIERAARVILISHLGRPKGKADPALSLEPVAALLRELVAAPVSFVADTTGAEARAAVAALVSGSILLLENVRFLSGEEKNDAQVSADLAALADVYVNDAFGAAHRAHASTAGVAEVMRQAGKPAVAGFLMERELRFLGQALGAPARPFVAILGGAKISGKIDVIEALLPRVDALLVGGAMANTFFRALGLETGKSLVEEEKIDMARELLGRGGSKLFLPVDAIVAPEMEAGAPTQVVARDSIPADARVLDIGPASVAVFEDAIGRAATILWNGPVGLFEIDDFAEGTRRIARCVAAATERGAVTIAGGGDTAAALVDAGQAGRLTHVSTGGGASLEFLEGRILPGVAALEDAP
jgi:phosphoglycerate kinase